MDKAVLERRLHLTVTFIGGFMGCYAIFNRSDVFGSAQTGNLISFVMDLVGRTDAEIFFRFSALLIYIFAMVSTVFLSHKMERTTLKFISVLIDGLAFVLLAFLPQDMDPFVLCIQFFLLLHFNGVPSKVPMVLTAPASSPPTISVSVRQDLQSTFTAEIPKHSEEVSSMEKCFFPFISELQCASCSAPDSIWQAHGQDFSRYAPHSSLSMRNALFPEQQKKRRFSGFTPESLLFGSYQLLLFLCCRIFCGCFLCCCLICGSFCIFCGSFFHGRFQDL